MSSALLSLCILSYMIIRRRLGTRQRRFWTRDRLDRRPQSNCIGHLTTQHLLSWFFRISCQISMCICLHLLVLILSADSNWLISITVLQTLTGNRINLYLVMIKRWSSQSSGVYTMGQVMRKCVFWHMRTTKMQISLRIRAAWSAPLLLAA